MHETVPECSRFSLERHANTSLGVRMMILMMIPHCLMAMNCVWIYYLAYDYNITVLSV